MFLFCDAAWGLDGEAGLSCVITSDGCEILRILSRKTVTDDAIEAEIRAILLGLESLSKKARHMKGVVLYTDNRGVAKAINGVGTTTHMDLIEEVQKKLGRAKVCWIPREENSRADAISVLALTAGSFASRGGCNGQSVNSIKSNPLESATIL